MKFGRLCGTVVLLNLSTTLQLSGYAVIFRDGNSREFNEIYALKIYTRDERKKKEKNRKERILLENTVARLDSNI